MSVYQDTDWENFLRDSRPEQRLAIMFIEMRRHIDVIQGYAEILKINLAEENAAERLEEFQDWAERILIAVNDLETLRLEISSAGQKKT